MITWINAIGDEYVWSQDFIFGVWVLFRHLEFGF